MTKKDQTKPPKTDAETPSATDAAPNTEPSEGESTARQLADQTRALQRDTQRVAEDIQELYTTATSKVNLGKMYQDNPYAMIGAALGVGYVLGGGLFTPFTRRLWRVGARAFVVPLLISQLKGAKKPDSSE